MFVWVTGLSGTGKSSVAERHVQRARHHADVARRRYLTVDPDNGLVADTLEADWNDALRQLRDAQDDCDRATKAATALSDEHKTKIRALAANFPAVWSDPATPQRERKRMIRLLVEDVTIDRTDVIHLHVRFKGGQTTSITAPIPLKAWQAHQTNADTLALLDRLLNDHTDAGVAAALNHAGHLTGHAQPFTSRIVLHLRRNHQLPSRHDRLRATGKLTIPEIADALNVHPSTIKAWHRAGLLPSHKADDRNTRLFDPPLPGEPRLVKRKEAASPDEFPPNQHQEVQYETIPLSQQVPFRPSDRTTPWSWARVRKSRLVYWQPRSEWKITPAGGRR